MMKELRYGYIKRDLQFNFQARTSRGEINTHNSYLVWAMHPSSLNDCGWGEAAPLLGLSPEGNEDFEELLNAALELLNEGHLLHDLDLAQAPSIRFAVETAQLDLWNGANRILFDNPFTEGKAIPINGLVWMADTASMLEEAFKKAEAGFDTLKFKIGAQQLDDECKMLEQFRKRYPHSKVEIRLDANGAFAPDEAVAILKEYAKFTIHSVEQPIRAGLYDAMQEVCGKSAIPIALDEELIGINVEQDGSALIQKIRPHFLILKPTLLGGLQLSAKWVRKAQEAEIGWWATSALESNIGLNAIAQWTSVQPGTLKHGLGTGSLYSNNIQSPLLVKNGALHYIATALWQELSPL
jgi:o-succinylbenzoate synthase